MTLNQHRLELINVTKTFGSNRVLSGVDLSVDPGEICGLAGQNGSGKSTLIKILTGIYSPDAGATIRVDGEPLTLPVRWREAHAAGIAVVHQDLGLLDHLTVAENVCVGGFPTGPLGKIDRLACDRKTSDTLQRIGAELSPRTLVGELSAAERAEVAIARALRDHAPGRGVMIMDESTRALRGADLERVHQLLRHIVADGSSVVLISHSLSELTSVPDRVTVLRDGVVTADLPGGGIDLTGPNVARAMLGATSHTFARAGATKQLVSTEPAQVVVRGLSSSRITSLDLSLDRGEVVGITGMPGNGYEEIPALLTGGARALSGTMSVRGRTLDLSRGTVPRALAAGVMLVPERRDRDGLAMEMTVRDNVTLPQLRSRPKLFLSRIWQTRLAERAILEHGVRPAAPRRLIRELSGGNQQKVLLAKWLTMRPSLLVLHEPTQAVDVGARQDILTKIAAAADSGTSVLIVSSEADDLVAICDRVLIYTSGGVSHGSSTDSTTLLDQVFLPTARNSA